MRMTRSRVALFLTCVAVTICWTNGQTRSCLNTRNIFEGLRVLDANGQTSRPTGVIFDQLLYKPAGEGVCKLDETCCSDEAEKAFKVSTVKDYHSKVTQHLSGLMECHNQPLFNSIRTYINGSKANLISDMYTAFLFYFQPYEHIFDTFYEYLSNSILSGDTCQLQLEFNLTSFEVFLAALNGGSPTQYPDDEDYQQCVYRYFLDSNEISLYNTYTGFTRAFHQLLRYLRGLKMVESIVESVLSHQLSSQCNNALMKMSYCSQCAGFSSSFEPCNSLCVNIMRGCLLDLADLAGPIKQLSDALERAKVNLKEIHRPWEQIILLSSRFFILATTTMRRSQGIPGEIASRCGTGGSGSQFKRQASTNTRFTRVTLVPPLTELNESAYCLKKKAHLFTSLPQSMCGQQNIASNNDNCWTGQTVGSYGRSEIAFNRAAQKDNPEMIICSQESAFKHDIAKMKYVTRELNSLTESLDCSPDDEDCTSFTVKPTCHYFDFSDVDIAIDSSSSASGSTGCSSADGSAEHCYDPCSEEVTTIPPGLETTTTNVGDISTTFSITTPPNVGVEDTSSRPPILVTDSEATTQQNEIGSSSILNFSVIVTVFSLAIGGVLCL